MKWNDILPEEVRRLAVQLAKRAEEERVAGKQIFPPQNCIFQALEATPPDRVKAVIVGQDPYQRWPGHRPAAIPAEHLQGATY